MKKVIIFLLLIAIILPGCVTYDLNEWFTDNELRNALVPDLPSLEHKEIVKGDNGTLYVWLSDEEYKSYVSEVYNYMINMNFRYLVTTGRSNRDDLFDYYVTYFVTEAKELSEFYDDNSGSYRFVYSNERPDEYGSVSCRLLEIYRSSNKSIKFDGYNITYNTEIVLCNGGSTPYNYSVKLSVTSVNYSGRDLQSLLISEYCKSEFYYNNYHTIRIKPIEEKNISLYANNKRLTPEKITDEYWEYKLLVSNKSIVFELKNNGYQSENCYLANLEPWLQAISPDQIKKIKTYSLAEYAEYGDLITIQSVMNGQEATAFLQEYQQLTVTNSPYDVPPNRRRVDVVEFYLNDGSVRTLRFDNIHYTYNGKNYMLTSIPKLASSETVNESYSFVVDGSNFPVRNVDDNQIISYCNDFDKIEFVLDHQQDAEFEPQYYLDTSVGRFYVVDDRLFYSIDENGIRTTYTIVGDTTFEDMFNSEG